jgi:hypothetical protein
MSDGPDSREPIALLGVPVVYLVPFVRGRRDRRLLVGRGHGLVAAPRDGRRSTIAPTCAEAEAPAAAGPRSVVRAVPDCIRAGNRAFSNRGFRIGSPRPKPSRDDSSADPTADRGHFGPDLVANHSRSDGFGRVVGHCRSIASDIHSWTAVLTTQCAVEWGWYWRVPESTAWRVHPPLIHSASKRAEPYPWSPQEPGPPKTVHERRPTHGFDGRQRTWADAHRYRSC